MGHLDLNGSLERLYGGLGLAVDQPQLEVVVQKQTDLCILCPTDERERIEKIACKYLEYYKLPGIKIEVINSLPSHSGLGSGTQLALALGFAITRVYGLETPIAELAVITDREGSRSGIGVAAFEQGGFVVDGGKPINSKTDDRFLIPPLLARMPFPEEWAVILALPHKEEKIFGSQEEKAFNSLPPMDEQISATICRLVLMKLLPSLQEKNLLEFGQAVTTIQNYVGNYFAPFQGGKYSSPLGFELEKFLLSQGATGIGQSSWGPTIYAFTTLENSIRLLEHTRSFLGKRGQVWIVKGTNRGASWGWK